MIFFTEKTTNEMDKWFSKWMLELRNVEPKSYKYYIGYDLWKNKQQLPTKVFFNDKKGATTLIDGDNVSVVKTTKGDKYSKEYGFLLAYFQMYSGLTKTQANKYLKDLVKDE